MAKSQQSHTVLSAQCPSHRAYLCSLFTNKNISSFLYLSQYHISDMLSQYHKLVEPCRPPCFVVQRPAAVSVVVCFLLPPNVSPQLSLKQAPARNSTTITTTVRSSATEIYYGGIRLALGLKRHMRICMAMEEKKRYTALESHGFASPAPE